MKTKNKKIKTARIISNIFLIITILILNYPTGTDVVNAIKTSKMYSDYTESVENLDLDSIEKEVKVYNEALLKNTDRLVSEKKSDKYDQIMDIKNGIMCYVNCENAGIINVPVYHNTTTEILQVGAGHICGTSFPSDQKGVNSAISGHSGMAGMKMFSQLPRVVTGDIFTVTYLNKTLVYTVDKITTTVPDDTSPLAIDEDQNYCTLITCTPIGVNTHRLIVRGVLTDIKLGTTSITYGNQLTFKTLLNRFATYELVMSGISLIFVVILISDIAKDKKKKIKNDAQKGQLS